MKYKQRYFLLFLTSFILTTSCIKWVDPPTEGLVVYYSFGAYETRNDNRLSGAFYTRSSTASTNDHVKSYYENDELSLFPDPALWTVFKPRRLELKRWTHCVINVTPVEIQAYIDGDLCVKKKREYSEYYDNPFLPTYIGNNLSGGEGSNNHFNGALDELRIYNRELTKEEIRVLYNNK